MRVVWKVIWNTTASIENYLNTRTVHFLEEPPEFFKVVHTKRLHAQVSSWAASTYTTHHPELKDNRTIQNLKATTFQCHTWMHWSFN